MPNQLIDETSPYLLQHAHNPVEWHPWNDATLAKAKSLDKPLLISVGYAACHWCHVMERESFEDADVAEKMNDYFICIKVDREERPDIDQIYMDAVTAISGRGGWPLNAFALPDGRPFSGGTYFPKDRWLEVLDQLGGLYREDRERVERAAQSLTQHLRDIETLPPALTADEFPDEALVDPLRNWMTEIDFEWGGRKVSGNKFPMPINYRSLLEISWQLRQRDPDDELAAQAQAAVDTTLEKMALGGIYDQLGGGFARYSVDPYWKVPHFEKMLYDNGQLVSLYAQAYATAPEKAEAQRALYTRVVYETIGFVQRELCSEEGGFYSSLDADSEGEEGKFYTWLWSELSDVLGDELRHIGSYYNAHPHGNWEQTNVLYALETPDKFAQVWKLDEKDFRQTLADAKAKLLEARAERVRPALDDKILTSWNALMLNGIVDAYRVFGEPAFLDLALRNARFLDEKLTSGGKLWRNYKAGKRSIPGFLDDYAYLIEAYLNLYQVSFDEKWFERAQSLTQHVRAHFSDADSPFFFYVSDETSIPVKRKRDLPDDVTPSTNSVMAHNLRTLGLLLGEPAYLNQARAMLRGIWEQAKDRPSWFAGWIRLYRRLAYPEYEVAVTGPEAMRHARQLQADYAPNRIYAAANTESQIPLLGDRIGDSLRYFVCQEGTCELPVASAAEARKQLGKLRR